MISPEVFMIANGVLWGTILVLIAVEERRSRNRFQNRHGAKYRRVSTADVLKMIRKAAAAPQDS